MMTSGRVSNGKLLHLSSVGSNVCTTSARDTFSTPESNESTEFYFESDHIALKGNREYLGLLKTVAVLEAQRYQAVCDVEKLASLEKKVAEDPMTFAENVLNGNVEIPAPQVICSVPNVEWSKISYLPEGKRPLTRNSLFGESKGIKNDSDYSNKNKVLVRGRVYDESKPETFNQLWTVEEQRRLEKLLIEYPPEEVETNRWRKIAAALGNRTPRQVCSRIQKYFLKLQKAGLPVPGRPPKSQHNESTRRSHHHNYLKKNRLLFRPSTFFPAFDLPVHMNENDADFDLPIFGPSDLVKTNLDIQDSGSRLNMNTSVRHMKHIEFESFEKLQCWNGYQKVEILKAVLREKESGLCEGVKHCGFKCVICDEEPIAGVRWHCLDCKSSNFDFCSDCVVRQLDSSANHPRSHFLARIKTARESEAGLNGHYDQDYLYETFIAPDNNMYNYLDPNFMPA